MMPHICPAFKVQAILDKADSGIITPILLIGNQKAEVIQTHRVYYPVSFVEGGRLMSSILIPCLPGKVLFLASLS